MTNYLIWNYKYSLVAWDLANFIRRNLKNRIEICIDIMNRFCWQRLIYNFRLQWQDNTKSY